MSDEDETLNRRQFLIRAGCTGLLAAGAGRFTAGCQTPSGSDRKQESTAASTGQSSREAQGTETSSGRDSGTDAQSSDTSHSSNSADATANTGDSQKKEEDLDCTDVSGLDESELKTRENLEYTDSSPRKNKDCANCQLYRPADEKGTCGGCQVVAGPIHPDGYCTAWIKKA